MSRCRGSAGVGMDSNRESKPLRFFELDGLRGVAALSVLFYHYTFMYEKYYGHHENPLVTFSRGKLGVDLFFIISGFVILMTISRANSVLDFVVSRVSRIYPVYWVAIIFTFAVLKIANLWPTGETGKPALLLNFTMLQRFFSIQSVDGVYWSLQYELLFYGLMIGVLVVGLIRHVEWVCAGFLGFSLLYWALLKADVFASLGTEGSLIKQAMLLALILQDIEFFVSGMMLYRARKEGITPLRLAIIASAIGMSFLVDGALIGCVHAAFVVLVGLAVYGYLPPLKSRVMIFLGGISYPLYLTHQYAGYVLIHKLEAVGLNANIAIILTIPVAITVATLLSVAVERPALRFIRDRYAALKQSGKLSRLGAPAVVPIGESTVAR